MSLPFLTALPVFNEARYVDAVLDEVRRFSSDILVVDDGSSDETPDLLLQRDDVKVERHEINLGYGAALKTAFCYAIRNDYECIVTIDCDGQHEPQRIPEFVEALQGVDIVSGSRYLKHYPADNEPPAERRRINKQITSELNDRLGLDLSDSFCGFKAYRASALEQLQLDEPGYAMPLQLWVEAVHAGLKIIELPVPLIYLDEERSFGGELDDGATRLAHYYEVLDRSMANVEDRIANSREFNLCGESVG